MRTPSLLLAVFALFSSCASDPAPAPVRAPWDAPPLGSVVSVRDGRTGEVLALETLYERLAAADVVFLGETHLDETTHRLELAVYEAMLARREGAVVLSLEMFERDVQESLDAYLAGRTTEDSFLAAARPWSNYATAYRPLIERARAARRPVVAANFPAPLRRRIAQEGPEVLGTLEGDAARQAPAELLANTPAYWRRVDNAIRGHIGMMGPAPAPDDPRLTATQSLWDNSMGAACARALAEHPGHQVLHVNGGFHTAYWEGTARQLRLRAPEAEVLTVAIQPTTQPHSAPLGGLPQADFVVFAEARAEDVSGDTWKVRTALDVKYRLFVPERASERARVPLLVWLGDDGFGSADGLALWRARLGQSCAILALDAPHRELQEDLVEGGRWFFADTFNEDVGLASEVVERAWAFVLRHQPVDPARVVLAGEGTGATLAAVLGVHSGRLAGPAIALHPRRFTKLKDLPLPLPELRGEAPPPDRTLTVVTSDADREWWTKELEQVSALVIPATLELAEPDDAGRDRAEVARVRAALGLRAARTYEGTPRTYGAGSARARAWGRLEALALSDELEAPVGVVFAPADSPGAGEHETFTFEAEDAARLALPRAPGAFGGTTVLVLPEGLDEDVRAAWLALEQADPLNAASRFHRLRIAEASGERALRAVLEGLIEAGRTNVLVAPAVFCADAETMRALRRGVRELEDSLSLSWRPGLGGLGRVAPGR